MSTALPYLSLFTSLAGINLRKIALLSLLASYKITDTSAIALPESQSVAAAMNENEPSLDLISANSAVASPAKPVFAHFIVGNTYDYNVDDWLNDITLAASKGLDAFALNIGRDNWQIAQVAYAYAAAHLYNSQASRSSTSPFKLFLSFDMSSFPCASADDATPLQRYIDKYSRNLSSMRVNGHMLVSTFAGESCTFGSNQGLNDAWTRAVKPGGGTIPNIWFVPSFFIDPTTFPSMPVLDGAFQWNSGWPMDDNDITFTPDSLYISNLHSPQTYMAAVSPWFFTHYGPDTYNKNFIYRGDDWLFAERWELLFQNRDSVPLVQVATWNDYGESHYVGPIEGIQPMSNAWVDGFDHQGWLDLMKYYITAYKTGSYPTISKDRIFLWARLYPAQADPPAGADPVGRPAHSDWTEDYLWAITFLTSPASVTLSCGDSTMTTDAPAGLTKLKLPLSTDCDVQATVVRGQSTVLDFAPAGFTFSTHPPKYNFNAFVAASPA